MRLLICFLLFSGHLFSQIGTGQWRLHVPAYTAIDVVEVDNKLYTAYENGISEYSLSTNEISVWDAVNGLSDISVSCLGVSNSGNAVFIGYENGNLDKLQNNSVRNIPAIKLAQVQGSKRINKIVPFGDYVYLATGFAIVKIDPRKEEVRDTYYPTNGTEAIIDLAFRNDSIFALTADRLYTGVTTNPALADPTQWTQDARVPVQTTHVYNDVEVANDDLFISMLVDGFGMDSVYQVTGSGMEMAINETWSMEISSLQYVNQKLVVNLFDASKLYNADLSTYGLIYSYGFTAPNPKAITWVNGKYYVADGKQGLVETNGSSGSRVSIIGPPKNNFYAMDWNKGKLAIAGGGLSGIFSTYNTSGAYVFSDEDWTLFDQATVSEWAGQNIWDFLGVSVNPTNTDEIAISTFSQIPLTIVDSNGGADTLTPNNSGLEYHNNGQGGIFVSDVQYDNAGNLWVLNGQTEDPLKVLTTDGDWYAFNAGSSSKNRFSKKLVVDNNDNKWFILRDVGVIGYDDGGTIENASDDEYVILNSGQNTGALPSNEVNAVAVDRDGEVWIGTDNGFAVLYNSTSAFGAAYGDYNAQRIKLEFEGNVEYVLGSTNITDIAVDGANRKWFGTSNAGVILLSEDGLEIIEQHTMENSPLISDNVLDLEIDQNTGELFIVTDKGLISYRTDASQGMMDYDNVTVFPNPVRPEYDGLITIQGIKYDSDVKITDVAGNLVYKTNSNGGTATWNGRTLQGEKVSTGVYLIWTAPNDDNTKGRKVGKVLVVN